MNIGALVIIAIGVGCVWMGFTGSYVNVWSFITGSPVAEQGAKKQPGTTTSTTQKPTMGIAQHATAKG